MHSRGTQLSFLLTLLIVPGLLGLMLLMQWLETHLTVRSVAEDIARLLRANLTAEELEAAIAQRAKTLFRDPGR